MKKILASLGIFSLFFTAAPTVTFANVSNDEALASEISSALARTANANFSANAQVSFMMNASNEDFSALDVQYDSGLIVAQKNKNAFSVSTHNETFSIHGEKNADAKADKEDFLFPIHISGKYAGSLLADFDVLKFAGKFDYQDVTVEGNDRLENIITGALELVDPVENKWIELDFEALHNEFPEILDDYEDTQEELSAYLNREGFQEFEDVLLAGVEKGVITLKKSGNTYSIQSENPLYLMSIGGKSPVMEITVNAQKVITDFSLQANVNVSSAPLSDGLKEFSGKLDIQAHFTYGAQKIIWPVFQENDWELTKVVRMFMEFVQAENDFKKIEYQFWYDLEKISDFRGDIKFDINVLKNNNLAVESYMKRYPHLETRLGAGDVLFLARKSGIELSDWEKDEVRDTFSFEEDSYSNDNVSKGELLLGLFVNEAYAHQPWDVEIDEESIYELNTKADFLYFLANGLVADNGGL